MLRVIQTLSQRRRHLVALALISLALPSAGLTEAKGEKRAYSDEELTTLLPPNPNPFLSNLPKGEE